MKFVTDDNFKNFIIKNVENVNIIFEDGKNVALKEVSDYSVVKRSDDTSYITLYNKYINTDLKQSLCNKKHGYVTLVRIELNCTEKITGRKSYILQEIPCKMKETEFQISYFAGDTTMVVELRGVIQ